MDRQTDRLSFPYVNMCAHKIYRYNIYIIYSIIIIYIVYYHCISVFVFVCLCLCHHGVLAVSGSVCHPNRGGFEHESDKDKKFKAFKITIKTQTNKARLRTSN
jgi:hypothetical protein